MLEILKLRLETDKEWLKLFSERIKMHVETFGSDNHKLLRYYENMELQYRTEVNLIEELIFGIYTGDIK